MGIPLCIGDDRVALIYSGFERDESEFSSELNIGGTKVKYPFDDVYGGILGTELKKFSYSGTPCGLVEALSKTGLEISVFSVTMVSRLDSGLRVSPMRS